MSFKNYKIIAVDFDGTIVEHRFPSIGEPLPHAIRVLKRISEAGHHIVLNTCREDDDENNINRKYLTHATQFLKGQGVTVFSVNENALEDDFRYKGLRRKPYANLYIDDKAFGTYECVDWLHIEAWLIRKGWLANLSVSTPEGSEKP